METAYPTILELISLIASVASLILAVVAIWLSFKFFEKSNESSEKTNEASKGISSSVERLEKLFDKLYSDTFSVMKDTVSDMRKHLWSKDGVETEKHSKVEELAEKRAEDKILSIKTDLSKELSQIFQKQKVDRKITDEKIESIRDELSTLLEKAISASRDVEVQAREETIRDFVLRKLKRTRKLAVIADDFVDWAENEGLSPGEVFREIEKMAEDNIVSLSRKVIDGPDVKIKLK